MEGTWFLGYTSKLHAFKVLIAQSLFFSHLLCFSLRNNSINITKNQLQLQEKDSVLVDPPASISAITSVNACEKKNFTKFGVLNFFYLGICRQWLLFIKLMLSVVRNLDQFSNLVLFWDMHFHSQLWLFKWVKINIYKIDTISSWKFRLVQ